MQAFLGWGGISTYSQAYKKRQMGAIDKLPTKQRRSQSCDEILAGDTVTPLTQFRPSPGENPDCERTQ
jgi:hypothetical protein